MGLRGAAAGMLLLGAGTWSWNPALTPISAIQGASHVSPLLGREVTTGGVITAVRDAGFYLQDAAGDGDPATSEGIFVESHGSGFVAGARVRLTGTVAERPSGGSPAGLPVTSLVDVADITLLAGGRDLPAPVAIGAGGLIPPVDQVISRSELPVDLRDPRQARSNPFTPATDALDFLETLEGMLVTVRRPTALSPTERRSGGRAEVFVHPEMPPAHAGTHARTAPGGILLRSGPDDRGNQNPERLRIGLDPAVSRHPFPDLTTGDRLRDVTGVLEYAYGFYQVSPIAPVTVASRSGWRPEATTLRVGSDRLLVGTYNLLNLSPDSSDDRQRARLAVQIARALRSPQILALQEIQDASGELDDGTVDGRPTLEALVGAIRAAGGPHYGFAEVAPADGRPGGVPGGNIRNAVLYDSSRVRLVSYRALTPGALAGAGAPQPRAFADSRDPLEAVFEIGGRRLVTIVNHLTSRYGSTPVFGAVQPWVEAGEKEREAQVRALHAYVARITARDPVARVVVLGDMNTFEYSDDLSTLLPGTPPILTNLVTRVSSPQRYTYIFEGNSQVLDHIFVTGSLTAGAEVDIVHLNADFPYEVPASDHDPVLASFRW